MTDTNNQSIGSPSSISSSTSSKNLDRRRSQRRRTNIQPLMRSSALPTTILHENNCVDSSITESTADPTSCSLDQPSPTEYSSNLVFRTDHSAHPKSTYWTVTDRQSEWYKLSTPNHQNNVNSICQSVPFKLLTKITQRTRSNMNLDDEINNPTDTTQLIMKAVMKELDYDLDEDDLQFLNQLNRSKTENQQRSITEDEFENAIIILEFSTAENIRSYLRQKLCDDKSILCDICLLPDADDGNEMVFCERCHICVHQNCYGIPVVPSDKWLCKPCSIIRRPACLLCPKMGGPMKSTSSGTIWCHLTCALWLPELRFSDYAKMEPILNLHRIPHARWSLRCVVCSTSEGACVQCAHKNCRTPFHVTCGLAASFFLDVQQISSKESRVLRSQFNAYCLKHSAEARQSFEKVSSNLSTIHVEDDDSSSSSSSSSTSSTIPLTIYRRDQLKCEKWIDECYKTFFSFISSTQLNDECSVNYDQSTSMQIFNYWKTKREKNCSMPLINRIDLVLEQRENAELLISQINICLHIRKQIVELKNRCEFLINSTSTCPLSLNQRFQSIKNKYLSASSTNRMNRCRRRTLDSAESLELRLPKRNRQKFSNSSEYHEMIERAKCCQVTLESTYRQNLQLNTTYFVVKTFEGEMILLPKTLLEQTNLISTVDSNETERENNDPSFPSNYSDASDDDDRIKHRVTLDIAHTIKTPYRSQGNVVTCVTGSFN